VRLIYLLSIESKIARIQLPTDAEPQSASVFLLVEALDSITNYWAKIPLHWTVRNLPLLNLW